jgi:hypothetical protein
MDFKQVLTDLLAEKTQLEKAITALETLNTTSIMPTTPRRGRPVATATSPAPEKRGPRRMSAAARRRIAEAQKKRWALQKAQAAAPAKKAISAKKAAPAKKAAKKTAPARYLSAAARKAMSEASKKRWAAAKKAAK